MANKSRKTLRVGDRFELGNPRWGRAVFFVTQRLATGELVLYRENHGCRDERQRWYLLGGGPGKPGLRLMDGEG